MAVSDQEEDNEVAEILQHQLYYNGDVLDSSLEVVSKYKDQSVALVPSLVKLPRADDQVPRFSNQLRLRPLTDARTIFQNEIIHVCS
jgi:hypothetical protein